MTKVIILQAHYEELIKSAAIASKLNEALEDAEKERDRLSDEIRNLQMNMRLFWMKRFAKRRLELLDNSYQGWSHVVEVLTQTKNAQYWRQSEMEFKHPCEPLDESSSQTASDNQREQADS
jgi:hypothetical protein